MENIILNQVSPGSIPEVTSIHSISYVSIIIFFLILTIGFFVGFMNGTKTSLYFLVCNIVIVGVYFAAKSFFNDFIQNIYNGLEWSISKNKFFYPIIYLSYLFTANVFILNIYWFFRSKLKESIKTTKQEGESVIKSRIGGGLIAIFTFLPFAIVFMQISVVIFGTDTFTDYVTNYLFRYLTLENIKEYSNIELYKYVDYWNKLF